MLILTFDLFDFADDWSKFTLKGQGPNTGQKFRNPCGLTFHDDQLLVCDKGNNIVQILNQDYKCESLLGSFSDQFAKPFKPQSVAVSQDDHFFMLDDNNLQIVVCDQNNTVLGKFALPADTKPYCIALLKGFVLVTDIKGHRLLKYTKGGQYVTEIGSQGRGHTQFNYPYFVAVNSRDVIIVSDCNNHCIKCFDTEFNYLSQYGQLGRGDGKLFYVFSIAVDDDDNVYVCDSVNDRIAKWSSDGNWICNLFQGEVRHPEYIAVSRDRIYVRGAGDEHITVFSK
ncbi:tripartite motif-containing protein 2-like [Ptychodera flava]|uniref:tripartite motif-containing protein 2-like n=1 Tax=Ptychodera flava TaxID=63121 RepID=UPI00396A0738